MATANLFEAAGLACESLDLAAFAEALPGALSGLDLDPGRWIFGRLLRNLSRAPVELRVELAADACAEALAYLLPSESECSFLTSERLGDAARAGAELAAQHFCWSVLPAVLRRGERGRSLPALTLPRPPNAGGRAELANCAYVVMLTYCYIMPAAVCRRCGAAEALCAEGRKLQLDPVYVWRPVVPPKAFALAVEQLRMRVDN